jgi:ketosteroid isomerase-like protein
MTTNPQSLTEMKSAVNEARDLHVAAVNAGDVDAAAYRFAPDGVFLPPGAPALAGLAAIRGWFAQVFEGFRIEDFTLQPVDVLPAGNVVIEHGDWSAKFLPRNGSSALPAGGTYLTVYAEQPDGSVRMIRDTFNGLPG